jgi:hypothetical protein
VDTVSFTASQGQYWAVATGFSAADYTIGVSSGSADGTTSVSTDLTNPSMVDIATGNAFSIAANGDGYIGFPTQTAHAYGIFVYLTTLVQGLTVTPGYVSGVSLTAVANSASTDTEYKVAVGFRSAGTDQDYVAWIDNLSSSASTFQFVVQEAALSGDANGGSSEDPVLLTLGTQTWVGARHGSSGLSDDWLQFSTSATPGDYDITFRDFTDDLEFTVYVGDPEGEVHYTHDISAGSAAQGFGLGILSTSTVYLIRLAPTAEMAVNQASVGQVTITFIPN